MRFLLSTSGRLSRPSSAQAGYNEAAPYYDRWDWQAFWRANEFPIVLDVISQFKPRNLLDVGAGTGAFLKFASLTLDPSVALVGLDVSEGMLEQARARMGLRATFLHADIRRRLPIDRASFDIVTMMRVANHIADLKPAICEIARVLMPGGLFVATDFADSFEYVSTGIPTPNAKVSIETYKHSRGDWINALGVQFDSTKFREVRANELVQRDAGHIERVRENAAAAIFKVIVARRAIG